MTKQIGPTLTLSLLLVAPVALAQSVASDATPSPEAPGSAASAESSSTAASTTTAPAPLPTEQAAGEPAQADVATKLEALEAKVGGLSEAQAATDATVDGLKRIKLTGYIQGRWEHSAASVDGLKSDGKSVANMDRFSVRRGRFKAVYQGQNSEYVLQIDATGDGATLKDAEATIVDTWTPFNLRLTAGQFKVPFGYELLQSSGDREMPERSAIVRAYFDGERDRGLRLTARYQFIRLAVALINGNMVKDTSVYKSTSLYGTNDPNKFKDFSGRVGVDFGSVTGGVSAYLGHGPMSTTVTPGATSSDPVTITYDNKRRTRLGADVQAYFDVPAVGGLALKGELIWGSEKAIYWNDHPGNPATDVKKLGWILTAVQNIGDNLGVVVRVDQIDPNTSKDKDKVTTVGGGLMVYASNNAKLSVIYQHPIEEGTSVSDDTLVTQIQARF